MLNQLLITIYTSLLRLYPRSFRAEFAEEMREVFTQAIRAASLKSTLALAYLCFNELISLPISLIRVRGSSQDHRRPISALPMPGSAITDRSCQELILVLAVFLLPGGVILNQQSWQMPTASGLLVAVLFLLVMVFVGWMGGFPLWSFPYVSLIIIIAGYLVVFQWIISLASPTLIANFTPGPWDHNTYLMLKVASTGMLWLMLFCLTLLVVALLAVFNRFQPFFNRIHHDWTLFSYILYGESVFALLLLYDSRRFEPVYSVAVLLCLLGGIWFFLRSASRRTRLVALLLGLTLAVAIVVIQSWAAAGGDGAGSGVFLPSIEVRRLLLTWLWMAGVLALPGLIAHGSARIRRPPPPAALPG